MITNIKVENLAVTDGNILELNARSPQGYTIRQIEGLTPPKSIISTASNRFLHGTSVTNLKSDIRNIVMTLAPNEMYGESVFTLRYGLYDYFVPGQRVRITIEYDDKEDRYIEGVVETHESNIFSNEPLSQISIYCADPYFRTLEDIDVIADVGILPGTEHNTIIEVDGDVETPLVLELPIGSDLATASRLTGFTFDVSSPWMGSNAVRRFDLSGMGTTYGLVRGNYLELSSHVGSKYIQKRVGSQETSLMAFLELSSAEWPILTPGTNWIRMNATVTGTSARLGQPTITYRTRYSGA